MPEEDLHNPAGYLELLLRTGVKRPIPVRGVLLKELDRAHVSRRLCLCCFRRFGANPPDERRRDLNVEEIASIHDERDTVLLACAYSLQRCGGADLHQHQHLVGAASAFNRRNAPRVGSQGNAGNLVVPKRDLHDLSGDLHPGLIHEGLDAWFLPGKVLE
jgi:hypothetical protein